MSFITSGVCRSFSPRAALRWRAVGYRAHAQKPEWEQLRSHCRGKRKLAPANRHHRLTQRPLQSNGAVPGYGDPPAELGAIILAHPSRISVWMILNDRSDTTNDRGFAANDCRADPQGCR